MSVTTFVRKNSISLHKRISGRNIIGSPKTTVFSRWFILCRTHKKQYLEHSVWYMSTVCVPLLITYKHERINKRNNYTMYRSTIICYLSSPIRFSLIIICRRLAPTVTYFLTHSHNSNYYCKSYVTWPLRSCSYQSLKNAFLLNFICTLICRNRYF